MHDSLHTTILSTYPQAAAIVDIQSYRPGYLPYPARVTLQTITGLSVVCVLKVSAHPDKLAYEAQILRALSELQLPVPQVLGGPVTTKTAHETSTVLLLSELPGHPLPWVGLSDLATAYRMCQLLQTGVDTLHALTPRVLAHPIATRVPSITLESELQTITTRGGPWFDVPLFAEACALVQTTLPRFPSALVFSNGDYNPLNFLVDNDAISGWIDFEHACFEDPYIGFAKFVLWADDTYGWGAGAKVGLVERYLYEHQVAPAAFLARLVLRGLRHVQDTSPADPPHYMMHVITDALRRLTQVLS
jgi:aminoglycoside phosphotransferase